MHFMQYILVVDLSMSHSVTFVWCVRAGLILLINLAFR